MYAIPVIRSQHNGTTERLPGADRDFAQCTSDRKFEDLTSGSEAPLLSLDSLHCTQPVSKDGLHPASRHPALQGRDFWTMGGSTSASDDKKKIVTFDWNSQPDYSYLTKCLARPENVDSPQGLWCCDCSMSSIIARLL
jgi:hypothetical protein